MIPTYVSDDQVDFAVYDQDDMVRISVSLGAGRNTSGLTVAVTPDAAKQFAKALRQAAKEASQ